MKREGGLFIYAYIISIVWASISGVWNSFFTVWDNLSASKVLRINRIISEWGMPLFFMLNMDGVQAY